MKPLHFVVPDSIDDPRRPSGGNYYDRRVADDLRKLGWDVIEVTALDSVPQDALVVVDALVAPAVATHRRLVVLVHMPFERLEVLPHAAAVITTSNSTRTRLLEQFPLSPQWIHVAPPGVDAADLATGTADGGELLCVGAVAPHKGQDVLLDALGQLADLPWRCTLVGALDRDPGFVSELRKRPAARRVDFAGVRLGLDLDASYARSDLLVVPSRNEAYGMVVTEALARGIPVIAADVGGVSEALGAAQDGRMPGILVRPEDPPVLAAAIHDWLTDPALRADLRALARERRTTLTSWHDTARSIADVLARLAP